LQKPKQTTSEKLYNKKKAEDGRGWKWFFREEIENAEEITENIRFYAVKALEQLSVNKR